MLICIFENFSFDWSIRSYNSLYKNMSVTRTRIIRVTFREQELFTKTILGKSVNNLCYFFDGECVFSCSPSCSHLFQSNVRVVANWRLKWTRIFHSEALKVTHTDACYRIDASTLKQWRHSVSLMERLENGAFQAPVKKSPLRSSV